MVGGFDAIVIGAGHNGLIAAGLLARSGARTLVLERRDREGGCTDTSAPWPDHPDWKVNTYSYVAGLMPRAVIRDADLGRHGLQVMPYGAYVVPQDDGRMLELSHDAARTYESVAQFSRKDAHAYPAWERWLEGIADVVWPLFTEVPPNLGSLRPRDLVATGHMAWKARRLGVRGVADLTRLFTLSAKEILDEWFESEEVKGALAMTGTLGAYGGPAAPGTAYVLLHLTMGDPGDGHVGGWGFVRGGMGGLAAACRRAAEAAGAEVRTDAGVARILVRGGRVAGVALENGDELRAPIVVSSLHPKLTFLDLVGRDLLPADFVADIERFRCRGGGVKINLALGELPVLPSLERSGDGVRCRRHPPLPSRLHRARPLNGLHPGRLRRCRLRPAGRASHLRRLLPVGLRRHPDARGPALHVPLHAVGARRVARAAASRRARGVRRQGRSMSMRRTPRVSRAPSWRGR